MPIPQERQASERFPVPQLKQVHAPLTDPQQGQAFPDAAELQVRQSQYFAAGSVSSSAKTEKQEKQSSRARKKQEILRRIMLKFLSERIADMHFQQYIIICAERVSDKEKRSESNRVN